MPCSSARKNEMCKSLEPTGTWFRHHDQATDHWGMWACSGWNCQRFAGSKAWLQNISSGHMQIPTSDDQLGKGGTCKLLGVNGTGPTPHDQAKDDQGTRPRANRVGREPACSKMWQRWNHKDHRGDLTPSGWEGQGTSSKQNWTSRSLQFSIENCKLPHLMFQPAEWEIAEQHRQDKLGQRQPRDVTSHGQHCRENSYKLNANDWNETRIARCQVKLFLPVLIYLCKKCGVQFAGTGLPHLNTAYAYQVIITHPQWTKRFSAKRLQLKTESSLGHCSTDTDWSSTTKEWGVWPRNGSKDVRHDVSKDQCFPGILSICQVVQEIVELKLLICKTSFSIMVGSCTRLCEPIASATKELGKWKLEELSLCMGSQKEMWSIPSDICVPSEWFTLAPSSTNL